MERSTFAHIPLPAGVEWRGRVPAATDFLRELGVLLYPLTRGSGTKVKVLEALALGIPVVTTPEGGQGVAPSAGMTVETDDERIADATVALLDDPAARVAAGAEAHATFMRDHAPAVAARPVVDLYERMLA
jgi:glycosyltransferase involved in cell wall biosynthesis